VVKKKVVSAGSRAIKSAARAKEAAVVARLSDRTTGFIEFLRTQGVVGLAVGLAIGSVASSTVATIVQGFVNPLVQLAIGTQSKLQAQVWSVEIWGRQAEFMWGAVLSSLITLVATAFVIYLIVHYFQLDRLKKPEK
jgi:large conductance mechanosensitive channel